jgi:hypothetical protein
MKTATRPQELESLGLLLQSSLESRLSQPVPIQVWCRLQEETLMILAQHPADVELNPQQTFDFFEQTILEQPQIYSHQVKLYLRAAGQKQPYASYSFIVDEAEAKINNAFEEESDTSSFHNFSSFEEMKHEEKLETEPRENSETSTEETRPEHSWDQPIPKEDKSQEEEVSAEEIPVKKPTSKKDLLPLVVTGASLSLFVFLSSLFILTRPCVLGQCREIVLAEELSNQSNKTLQKPVSGKEVLEAQQQLQDAIKLLETIPPWSSKHGKAQELIKAYQIQGKQVNQMVTAMKTGVRAGLKGENPPHPASQWIEAQNIWREAIAQLEQLPTKSNLQPLAQEKIKAYKANLAQTNQRLVNERQAQEQIKAAKDAALIAEARQGVAQSLEHWQLVYSTWQEAMNRLKKVAQGTTGYTEAQQLSGLYAPKMASALSRRNEELAAANIYKQGLKFAELARNAQNKNQLSTAFSNWRNALAVMNQVPSNSFYHGKAQANIAPYTNSLNQVQAQLQLALKLQQARRDLTQTCQGKTKVCNYTINKNLIKVQLTPTYMEKVRQTALNAEAKGDTIAQSGVVNHILTLGEALEAISENVKIPLQVNAPDGSVIQSHNPAT